METLAQSGEIPFLLLPRREEIFTARSRRFYTLAENHALADYLRLMGLLSQSQQEALDALPPLPAPAADYLDQCRREQLPPLGVLGWQRDPVWRQGLQRIVAKLATEPLPAATSEALGRLRQFGDDDLEHVASSLLRQDLTAVPVAAAPFLAAALQVYWTAMADDLAGRELPRLQQANLCPVCGSLPVSSVVKSGGAENGLRYLCCSLCSSQWHLVRGICSNCDATQGLTYFGIEGQSGWVTAESCNECHTYLKIVKLEKSPLADPTADELALLVLDLLMDRKGQERSGINLLFHPGTG